MAFDKEQIIKLTLAVYQVTNIFPEKEPLRYKIRERADDILADFTSSNPQILDKEGLMQGINVILAFFEVAEVQDWADKRNFLVLAREYRQLREEIEALPEKSFSEKLAPRHFSAVKEEETVENKEVTREKTKKNEQNIDGSPVVRQKKIVEIVKNKREVSLVELQQIFSHISPRTLRRDLRSLVGRGVLERIRQSKKDVLFLLKPEFNLGQ